MSREMYMLMFFGELGSTLNAAHMRFDLYHPCIDHLPMVYTATCTRNAHAHVLPRARSMADACAYSVRGARFFIARAVTFLRRDRH